MVDPNEFIATGRTIKEIENFLGVDSLHYISYQGLVDCTGIPKEEFCLACLDGDYPIACYDEINYEKLMLEKIVNEK
jgi:amidophosphoribosyltransferase